MNLEEYEVDYSLSPEQNRHNATRRRISQQKNFTNDLMKQHEVEREHAHEQAKLQNQELFEKNEIIKRQSKIIDLLTDKISCSEAVIMEAVSSSMIFQDTINRLTQAWSAEQKEELEAVKAEAKEMVESKKGQLVIADWTAKEVSQSRKKFRR